MTGKETDMPASSLANDTKHGPITTNEAQNEGGGPRLAVETGAIELGDEADIGPAIFPPVLENMEVLGYIKDKNGICYPRDIGRSASFHDEVYFIFGDTVCKDAAGNSVGITSNTIAYVDDRANFLESEYVEISENGMVKAFVPLDEAETLLEKEDPDARVVFRMFGGAVDIRAIGVVWFQKSIEFTNGEVVYHGVGQAWLTTLSYGRLIVQRLPKLLFGPDEPRMGSFSTLYYDGYVYLWSHRPDGLIILARVYHMDTAHCERYEYWSGNSWVPGWRDGSYISHSSFLI